jgi:hypothetical protein
MAAENGLFTMTLREPTTPTSFASNREFYHLLRKFDG